MKSTRAKFISAGLTAWLAFGVLVGGAQAKNIRCEEFLVPVSLPGVAEEASIYGELCLPKHRIPDTVQLLVHSTWYNHHEWDPPQKKYSHVRAAVKAGFATFNIDRLGTGQSTKPPSPLVTPDAVVDSLHQVIEALRGGEIGGRPFSKVVWVGSSYGSLYGWINAGKYPDDVDAFVLNGLVHLTKASFGELAVQSLHSICEDPVFSQEPIDCGYITNKIGTKGALYYYEPEAAPGMLEGVDDFVIRDVVSSTLLAMSLPFTGVSGPTPPIEVFIPDPATSPSQNIQVPTLIALGERDNIGCGLPDGLECTREGVMEFEGPYFSIEPDLLLVPDTGHALTLHRSGPKTSKSINRWIRRNLDCD